MSEKRRSERITFADAQRYIGLGIGPFHFAKVRGKLVVSHEDGEAGVFTEEQLLPYLRQFWREEF